jgi:hypothetical protein
MITIEINTSSDTTIKINGKEISLEGSVIEPQPECRVSPNGSKSWYLNDQYHRVDGPAIEWANGSKEWYLNGKLHRVDGPAVENADGYKAWYLNDQLHRTDGPAIENANGYKAWWLNGEELNMEKLAEKSKNLSPEQKLLAIYLQAIK